MIAAAIRGYLPGVAIAQGDVFDSLVRVEDKGGLEIHRDAETKNLVGVVLQCLQPWISGHCGRRRMCRGRRRRKQQEKGQTDHGANSVGGALEARSISAGSDGCSDRGSASGKASASRR